MTSNRETSESLDLFVGKRDSNQITGRRRFGMLAASLESHTSTRCIDKVLLVMFHFELFQILS